MDAICNNSNMSPPAEKRRKIACEQLGLPGTLLYYLKKNSNPRLLLKFMQTSKYFRYKEFPFIVIKELVYEEGKWNYLPFGSIRIQTINICDNSVKYWITQKLHLDTEYINLASLLIRKIAACDITELYLGNQEITLNEFKLFNLGNIVKILLDGVTILKDDGEMLTLKEILPMLPEVRDFMYSFPDDPNFEMAPGSTKKIIELLQNSEITTFSLCEIPATFDFDEFSRFMIDVDQFVHYYLNICDHLSDEQTQKLQAFVDGLVINGYDNGYPPSIYFNGQTQESVDGLRALWDAYK